MLSYAVYFFLMLVPFLVGGGISARLGWALGKRVLAEEAGLPQWLEALAPLKGRWLRLLLTTPAILVAMAAIFVIAAVPLYYLILCALFLCYYVPILGYPALGLLGALGIAAILTLAKNEVRRYRVRRESSMKAAGMRFAPDR